MLVEHTFITTLEGPEVVDLAWDFLCGFGFTQVSRDPRSLHASRGRAKPKPAASVSDLPQAVRLDYDRGRVELAVTVTEPKKVLPLHRELALALAHGLEQLLAHNGNPEKAHWRIESAERENAENFRRRRRRRRIIIGLLVGFLLLWVVLIVWVTAVI